MKHLLHKSVDDFQTYEASDDWLSDVGSYPMYLPQVVLHNGDTIEEHWEKS